MSGHMTGTSVLNCEKYSGLYTLNTHRKDQISLLFALRPLVFQTMEVFGFPVEYNAEFQTSVKNQKLKIQNRTFVRTTEKKFQQKFGIIQKQFEGGVAF